MVNAHERAAQLINELTLAGYKCPTHKKTPSLARIEKDYHTIMLNGELQLAKCAKANQLLNSKYILSYIADFEVNDSGIYFKPNTHVKGTYAVIIGNRSVSKHQEYVRTLLQQGYEVIFHNYNHKGIPFQDITFKPTAPMIGLLINAHGLVDNNQHIFEFSIKHPQVKTLEVLLNLKTQYKLAPKFEFGIISCYSGALTKDMIKAIIPTLNELYLSSKGKYTTSVTSTPYDMASDARKYSFGQNISPTTFFTQKDPSLKDTRDKNLDYHENNILHDCTFIIRDHHFIFNKTTIISNSNTFYKFQPKESKKFTIKNSDIKNLREIDIDTYDFYCTDSVIQVQDRILLPAKEHVHLKNCELKGDIQYGIHHSLNTCTGELLFTAQQILVQEQHYKLPYMNIQRRIESYQYLASKHPVSSLALAKEETHVDTACAFITNHHSFISHEHVNIAGNVIYQFRPTKDQKELQLTNSYISLREIDIDASNFICRNSVLHAQDRILLPGELHVTSDNCQFIGKIEYGIHYTINACTGINLHD